MKKNTGRIGVLMGGPSSEREISIKSGAAVYEALIGLGLEAVCIDPKDIESVKEDIAKANISVAFIALHGRFGEDGTIQTILEEMNIPFTGSGPLASRLALNKALSRDIFKKNNIPVPRHKVLKRPSEIKTALLEFSLPFVMKPVNEGSSIGLSIIESLKDIEPAVKLAFSYDEQVIIEEYIRGEDITVGILNEQPLPVIHIKPKAKFYSYQAKYATGMTDYIVPAPFKDSITKEAQKLGLMSHMVLGCRSFSRVDMLLDTKSEKITVLEVNTIPGLTSSSLLPKAAKAIGISFPDLCLNMIESAMVTV